MKALIIGKEDRFKKYMPNKEITLNVELIFCAMGTSDEELIEKGKEAEILIVDAIATVSKNVIDHLPNLKLIHSEGVGYNGIDTQAAKEKGIFVCNNKGINAGAVAEQTILLMLGLLRDVVRGDQLVREGYQIQTKEKAMVEGITELADCKIGLIGFGDIAKETAKRLVPFECEIFYWNRARQSKEIEEEYQVTYLELDELASSCDFISLHVAVTEETTGMINKDFINKMKKTAYIINTARGELVHNESLREALIQGDIQGAGFDTVSPEPTTKDNPLVDLPIGVKEKVIYSPHIGGITTGTFVRAHKNIWNNIELIAKGERPNFIVNGL